MDDAASLREPRSAVTPLVRRHWIAFCVLLAGLAVHGTMILTAKPLQSANDRSRWCTVWSLLERKTYTIDEIRQVPGWDTIDILYDGGHFYSTKPPILSTWVAGVVWCVTKITGWSLTKDTQAVTGVTLLFVNGLPLVFAWIVFHRLLQQTMLSAWGHGVLLTSAVFATLLTPFAVTLNNHTVAAIGAMLTVYSWYLILRHANANPWWFAMCGFFAAWTCAHELPAALLGVITFLSCAWRNWWNTLRAYVPAAVIPLAFFFVTNWIATGSLKPAYSNYGNEKYRFVVEGVPSYWLEPKGIDQNLDTAPMYLFHCLVGHHGIFSLTPLWLLLIPAWIAACIFRRSANAAGMESVLSRNADALVAISRWTVLLTVTVLGFYFTRTENYNYGGVTAGLRWVLWLTPLWLTSLIPLMDRWSDRKVFRLAIVPLFLLSAFSAWSRIDNPWRHPWIFTWMESRGLIDISEPRPRLVNAQGQERKLWTWIAAVPDCSDGEERWMEFVNAQSPSGMCRLRLTAGPTSSPDAAALQVTKTCGAGDPSSICRVQIDRRKLANGAKPAELVRWPDADVSPAQQQADLAFLRGLPLLKEFRPGVVRYRKTLLRTDAFRCQHALSQVEADAPTGHRKWRYRCDVWLCDELPFGIAEVEFQVHDVTTGLQLHQERWQAADCYPPPLPHAQWSPSP